MIILITWPFRCSTTLVWYYLLTVPPTFPFRHRSRSFPTVNADTSLTGGSNKMNFKTSRQNHWSLFNVYKPGSSWNIQLVSQWSYYLTFKSPQVDLPITIKKILPVERGLTWWFLQLVVRLSFYLKLLQSLGTKDNLD